MGQHVLIRSDQTAWSALWAMVLGFFMILVDATIVSTAMPAIMEGLNAPISGVLWVTSAYLLAYAVPLLITGRLGDRFGPRTLYLAGLTVFTLASLWCGLSGTLESLVIARVVQGLGAAMLTPQTMTVITRMFPSETRGVAMGIWGATAGIATLVGPLVGGVIVDIAGWEWIFWVNVPVGVFALWRAAKFLPRLERHSQSLDLPGVVLSAVGLFLIVFGIQEGEKYDWSTVVGPISIPLIIGTGVLVMIVFVAWQAKNPREPLVPLGLFKNRNFSLANFAITTISFTVNSMIIPAMLYLQLVRGLDPTLAALSYAPMSLVSAILAPYIGRSLANHTPRSRASPGLLIMSVSLTVYAFFLKVDTPIWLLSVITLGIGLGSALVWSPVSITATSNLRPDHVGAGSGVFNTTRQVGAVLGSAMVAVLLQSRLAANLPEGAGASTTSFAASSAGGGLPEFLREGFSLAVTQTLFLPAGVLLLGAVAAAFFRPPRWWGEHETKSR